MLNSDGTWDTNWSTNPEVSLSLGDDASLTIFLEVWDGLLFDVDSTMLVYENVPSSILEMNWSVSEAGEPRTIGYRKHQCWVVELNE